MERELVGTGIYVLLAIGGIVVGSIAVGGVVADDQPLADAGLDQSVERGSTVYLDAGGSVAPDGSIVAYEWTIEAPNGTEMQPNCGSCESTSFVPTQTGTYDVTVQVWTEDGETATDTMYVDVSEPDGPTATLSGPSELTVGESGMFTLTTSDDDLETVSWVIDDRVENQTELTGSTSSFSYVFSETGPHVVEAVVLDSLGRQIRDSHSVIVISDEDEDDPPGEGGDTQSESSGDDASDSSAGSGESTHFRISDDGDSVVIDPGNTDWDHAYVSVGDERIYLDEYADEEFATSDRAAEEYGDSATYFSLDAADVLNDAGHEYTEEQLIEQLQAQQEETVTEKEDTIETDEDGDLTQVDEDAIEEGDDEAEGERGNDEDDEEEDRLYKWTETYTETEWVTEQTGTRMVREEYTYTETVATRETRTRTTTETYTTYEKQEVTEEYPIYDDVCIDEYTDFLGNTHCIEEERQQVGTETQTYTEWVEVETTIEVEEEYEVVVYEDVTQTGYEYVEKPIYSQKPRQVEKTRTTSGEECPSGTDCTLV